MATPKLTPNQISEVSNLVAGYILAQRDKYAARAVPLSAHQRAAIGGFFSPELLGNTRVLVLESERVTNPEFYPMLYRMGFQNLPDQSAMAAITFHDVVVSHEPFSPGLLVLAQWINAGDQSALPCSERLKKSVDAPFTTLKSYRLTRL